MDAAKIYPRLIPMDRTEERFEAAKAMHTALIAATTTSSTEALDEFFYQALRLYSVEQVLQALRNAYGEDAFDEYAFDEDAAE